jgi:hypothetical protein
VEAPAGPGAEKQPFATPVPAGTSSAPSNAPPATATAVLEVPPSAAGGPADPSPVSPPAKPSQKGAVIDLETIPSSTTGENAARGADPGGPVHKETEDASSGSTATADAPAQPTGAADPRAVQAGSDEQLPPLPADLGRTGGAAPVMAVPSPAPVAAPATEATSPGTDELPPLPADLSGTAPAQPAGTVAEQPPQPSATPSPHTQEDALPSLPAGNEQPPVLKAPTQGSPNVESGAPPAPPLESQNMPSTPAVTAPAVSPDASSTMPDTELPQLPASDVTPAPAPTATNQPGATNLSVRQEAPAPASPGAEGAPDGSSLPPALPNRMLASASDNFIPDRASPPSSLRPDLQREVEKIARSQEEELRRPVQNQPPAEAPQRDTSSSDLRTQTQLDISRAPSPAEARPIKAIPVPEDWVPLAPRSWSPQRKYWAAAATCHLPLYFQDPVLERYGHSVEQFVGPIGRYLTYPVDDPTQTTQRNQILQPFFSAGLMALQIAAWPYNLIMDPPWEAQYDLGYYRPGDNIPTDLYWLPLHGYGPPLRGSNY